MGDVVGAAADRAPAPAIDQVEHQRRMHAYGRVQRRGRAPGAVAHAGDVFAARAGGRQRHARPLQASMWRSSVRPRDLRPAAARPRNRRSAHVPPAATSSPSTCQGSIAWRSSSSMPCGDAPKRGKRNSRNAARTRRVEGVAGALQVVDHVLHVLPATKCGSMKRSCRPVPQRISGARRALPEARDQRAQQQHLRRLICACGGISKPRNSSRPRRPVAPSGEYSLSMQNSARCVLPVSRPAGCATGGRPARAAGGLRPVLAASAEGDFQFVEARRRAPRRRAAPGWSGR
jgi:hypothetical protein